MAKVTGDLLTARPSYMVPGFQYRRTVDGAKAGGFGKDPGQYASFFTTTWELPEWHNGLLVVVAAPPTVKSLASTENHSAETIVLKPGVIGFYHDGCWDLGNGPEMRDLGGVLVFWNRSWRHSVTVHSAHASYGVRGPVAVAKAELIRIAISLP